MRNFSFYFGIFLSISLLTGSALFFNRYYISQWVPGENFLPDLEPFADSVPASHPAFGQARWVHRVNSIERYKELKNSYNGFEIDIQFNAEQGTLGVGHDPDPNFSLSLEQLIAAIESPQKCYFWLDIKQLDTLNAPIIHETLLRLADKYGIRQNILVESLHPQALSIFTRSGFYTSYYLPPFHVFKCSGKEITSYYATVVENLSKSEVDAISGNHMQYLFMEKYFPGYDHLMWNLDIIGWRRNLLNKLYKESPRVNIILNPDITKHWR